MCTLLTVSQDFYLVNKQAITRRILKDAKDNGDGWSLICVDPLSLNLDVHLQTLSVSLILAAIDTFMGSCSMYGRIFLHSRYATTQFTGIAYNHGFTNHDGTMIQHNGVIENYRKLGVDSFNLIDYRTDHAVELRDDLQTAMEFWANVFLIRPNKNSYGVVRMSGGTLYTDREGNYSTHQVEDIMFPVESGYAKEHMIIPVRSESAPARPGILTQTDIDALAHPEDDEFFESAWDSYVVKKYNKSV